MYELERVAGIRPRPDSAERGAEGLTGAFADGQRRRGRVRELRCGQVAPAHGLGDTIPRATAAMRFRGVENSVADALSRFLRQTDNRDPFPGRHPRERFRSMVAEGRGCMGVGMTASDSGDGARAKGYRVPPNSALEGSLLEGRLRRFPPADLTF